MKTNKQTNKGVYPQLLPVVKNSFTSTVEAISRISVHTRAVVQTNIIYAKRIPVTNIRSQFTFVDICETGKTRSLIRLAQTNISIKMSNIFIDLYAKEIFTANLNKE